MNDYRAYVECDYNSIYHHGIKGQHWGVRRFQNEDGSLTEAGKKRYRVEYDRLGKAKIVDQTGREMDKEDKAHFETALRMERNNDQAASERYKMYEVAKKQSKNHTAAIALLAPGGILTASLYNTSTKDARQKGQNTVDGILAEYANSYLDDLTKK